MSKLKYTISTSGKDVVLTMSRKVANLVSNALEIIEPEDKDYRSAAHNMALELDQVASTIKGK
jgi:hypothetical protein